MKNINQNKDDFIHHYKPRTIFTIDRIERTVPNGEGYSGEGQYRHETIN